MIGICFLHTQLPKQRGLQQKCAEVLFAICRFEKCMKRFLWVWSLAL